MLRAVANAHPPYHALIDTGALITGISNQQVAEILLDEGLAAQGYEGVAFLTDEGDELLLKVRQDHPSSHVPPPFLRPSRYQRPESFHTKPRLSTTLSHLISRGGSLPPVLIRYGARLVSLPYNKIFILILFLKCVA